MKTLMVMSSECKEAHGESITQCDISNALSDKKVESVELIINGAYHLQNGSTHAGTHARIYARKHELTAQLAW